MIEIGQTSDMINTGRTMGQEPSKFHDCIIFRDEFDLLKLRIKILQGKVNNFYIFEGLTEHLSGKKRESYLIEDKFFELRQEFPDINLKHFTYELKGESPWAREHLQRSKIYDYLIQMSLDPRDIILISDCDEIPNPDKLDEALNYDFCFFDQMYFIHYANLYSRKNVTGTTAVKWHRLQYLNSVYGNACQWLRNNKDYGPEVLNGGWHISYAGGVDQVTKKGRTIAEGNTKYTKKFFREQIKEAVENLNSPYSTEKLVKLDMVPEYFGDFIRLRFTGTTKHQGPITAIPKFLLENPEKYKHLFV